MRRDSFVQRGAAVHRGAMVAKMCFPPGVVSGPWNIVHDVLSGRPACRILYVHALASASPTKLIPDAHGPAPLPLIVLPNPWSGLGPAKASEPPFSGCWGCWTVS